HRPAKQTTSTVYLPHSCSNAPYDGARNGRCRLSEASSEEVEEAGSPIVIVLPTAKRFSAMTHYGMVAMPVPRGSATTQMSWLCTAPACRAANSRRLLRRPLFLNKDSAFYSRGFAPSIRREHLRSLSALKYHLDITSALCAF